MKTQSMVVQLISALTGILFSFDLLRECRFKMMKGLMGGFRQIFINMTLSVAETGTVFSLHAKMSPFKA